MTRTLRPGDRYRITRIVQPDYDSYAVVHYEGGYAFGCGKAWFDAERPEVGRYIVFGADGHWHVEPSA